jgi:dihydrolipoamide dehydrogenase
VTDGGALLDVIVLGGGPAGYVAALRAAQLGGKVALVEEGTLGGTCLNVGCIPTKTLLHSAKLYTDVLAARSFGIEADGVRLNYSEVLAHKDQVVRRLTGGVAGLLKRAGVEVVRGRGRLAGPGTVAVDHAETRELKARAVIVATGSEVADLPMARIDGQAILGSTEALSLPEVPTRLLIVGGGVIGCEFATIFRSFGSEVTVVEAEGQLLPREDREAAEALAREFKRSGILVLTGARLLGTEPTAVGGVAAMVRNQAGEELRLSADRLLVSVGRRPRTAGLGLEALGVRLERGAIMVDARQESSVKGVYAAGDVTGGFQLAHVAFHEGAAAAEHALGHGTELKLRAVPRCVYTQPELGAVGLTEAEARERYGELKVGHFPFAANGKALALGEASGFVKVIAEARYEQVVGVVIVGPAATELVGEAVLAVAEEVTLAELVDGVHAHPTLSEALREAALAAAGRPLHGGH